MSGFNYQDEFVPHPVYLTAYCGKECWSCLLDSGCDITVVPRRLVAHCEIKSVNRALMAANGTP